MNKQKPLIIDFKTVCFRKIQNPYTFDTLDGGNSALKEPEAYVMICDVCSLPDNIPMETNPREQKLTTNVAKKIKNSLLNTVDKNFYLLNRGILLSAKDVTFDNKNNMAHVTFSDFDVHGNVDGGHTYKIICEQKTNLEPGQQFVKIEILTHIEEFFQALAEARNTSVQVQDRSIAELYNKFDIIKNAIKEEPYATNIFFKENDTGDIDIADVIAILNMFDLERYSNGAKDMATVSYSNKRNCIQSYIQTYDKYKDDYRNNPYYKMSKIIPDIFRLYDHLEVCIGTYYVKAFKHGKYGKLSCVSVPKNSSQYFKSVFLGRDKRYASPNSFLYPIIGAFRALVDVGDDGFYKWKQDPFTLLDKIGPDLVSSVMDQYHAFAENPNKTGKTKTTWMNLYLYVWQYV